MEKEKNGLSALVYGTVIIVVLLCAAFAFNIGNIKNARPPEFSKRNTLQALWYQYKSNYLEPGTLRSLDKQRQNITTSEGQSYTLLRAVWMDDKATFDSVWQWTKDNIQRKQDHLMSWLFGERADGSYGILQNQGGSNSAADADEDVALALLFANKRWNDQKYFGDAIVMIRDIWNKEVVMIGGKPYLAADNVEKSAAKGFIVVNPSYLSPYTYKIFAAVDPTHDWSALAATSYSVIDSSMRLALDKGSTAFIPPDWVSIDTTTGQISEPAVSTGLTTNFSFDAMRVPWRLALDYQWSGDPRAKAVLDKMSFLANEWRAHHAILSSYSHDGKAGGGVTGNMPENAVGAGDAPATYGGAIGYFIVSDTKDAAAVYRDKLSALYDPNESKWVKSLSYYDENWAWFGLALYDRELFDLSKNTP